MEGSLPLRRRQQGQIHRRMVFLHAALVAEFAVVGGGEGVEIGKIIAVGVQIRKHGLEAPPDAAPPPVLGQGSHPANATHFAGMAVKMNHEIRDGEGAHHLLTVQGRPAGEPFFVRLCGGAVHGLLKGDGEQLVGARRFLRGQFANHQGCTSFSDVSCK